MRTILGSKRIHTQYMQYPNIQLIRYGSSQYITVADSTSLQIPDVITMEAWVYPDTANSWDTIVSKMNAQTENLYFVLSNAANIYVGLAPVRSDYDTGQAVSAGAWWHVAVT